jgi:hypothetical protein
MSCTPGRGPGGRHKTSAEEPLSGKPTGPSEPEAPSLEIGAHEAKKNLPRDSKNELFAVKGISEIEKTEGFENLGLGVSAYMALLAKWKQLSSVCLLLSVPSMVTNAYGNMLGDKATLFTFTTLGNSRTIDPSYGATEFCISCLITYSLFAAASEMKTKRDKAEAKAITVADFALEMEFDGEVDVQADDIKKELEEAFKEQDCKAVHISVPRKLRAAIIFTEKVTEFKKVATARAAAVAELEKFKEEGNGLSDAAEARLAGLKTAIKTDAAALEQLEAKFKKDHPVLDVTKVPAAGFAYATMEKQTMVQKLLDLKKVEGKSGRVFKVARPPEPSDIMWPNLEAKDNTKRQIIGTIKCAVLSLLGSVVIGGTNYVLPDLMDYLGAGAMVEQVFGMLGTVIVIAGYLVIFIYVPTMEENYMRHRSISDREQSQVVKLVVFQVIATLATSTVYLLETGGAFSRVWYTTGGFLLINGMIVDTFFITLVVQGYQLNSVLIPQFVAKCISPPLTQIEANMLMAPKAEYYVTDRLQMTSKFVCMTYIYASAMPELWAILYIVCVLSGYLDTRNLLRVLQPPPRSDVGQVEVILTYVMPIVALLHLIFQYLMLTELMDGNEESDFLATLQDITTSTLDGLTSLTNVSALSANVIGGFHSTVGSVASMDLMSSVTSLNLTHSIQSTLDLSTVGTGSVSEDALWLIRLSIMVNGVGIFIFMAREWRQKLGLPNLAEKLKVQTKLAGALAGAGNLAKKGVKAIGKATHHEGDAADIGKVGKKMVGEIGAGLLNVGGSVLNVDLHEDIENKAEKLTYAQACKDKTDKSNLPDANSKRDPYAPKPSVQVIEKAVNEVLAKSTNPAASGKKSSGNTVMM